MWARCSLILYIFRSPTMYGILGCTFEISLKFNLVSSSTAEVKNQCTYNYDSWMVDLRGVYWPVCYDH